MHIQRLHESLPARRRPSVIESAIRALTRSAPRTAAVRDTDVAAREPLAKSVLAPGAAAQPAPSVAEGLTRADYDGSDLHSLNIWYPAASKAAIGPMRPIGPIPLVQVGPGGDFVREPRGDGAAVVVLYAALALLLWFWVFPALMGTAQQVKP